jgi:hypothetical protein
MSITEKDLEYLRNIDTRPGRNAGSAIDKSLPPFDGNAEHGNRMQIGRIEGFTRVLGERQGYLGLPVRDELINCSVGGESTPSMVTEWIPTAENVAAIMSGAPIHVRLIGTAHPPIMVEVGEAPTGARSSRPAY